MDYKKKYEEALHYIKDLIEYNIISIKSAGKYFPELIHSDEKIRNAAIVFVEASDHFEYHLGISKEEVIAWLEKQGNQPNKVSIWKHWKDGIAGNGEPVYLIKDCSTYSLSSVLSFECDYIELSELNNLMLEKQGEPKELSQSQVTEKSDQEQFYLFDEEKMAIDIAIKALNHTIVDESDRGLAADLLTKLKQRLNDFII